MVLDLPKNLDRFLEISRVVVGVASIRECKLTLGGFFFFKQRQTVVSQFFQLDRLVVEGQETVCHLPVFHQLPV